MNRFVYYVVKGDEYYRRQWLKELQAWGAPRPVSPEVVMRKMQKGSALVVVDGGKEK